MAIQRAHFGRLTCVQAGKIQLLERRIDQELKQRFTAGHTLTVIVPRHSLTDERVINELARRYGDAGWEIGFRWNRKQGAAILVS